MLAQAKDSKHGNRRYRALIADDDSRCRESLASLLKLEGFQTVPVGGGLAVLDLLLEQLNRQLLHLDKLLEQAEAQQVEKLEALDLSNAQEPCAKEEIDLLILDYNMPDITGLEVLAKLHREFDDRVTVRMRKTIKMPLLPPAIVVSGEASSELEKQVRSVGGFALVPKPIHPTQFREQVWNLVRSMLRD